MGPRAVDSLWLTLKNHGLVPTVPYGDVLLFCTSTSGLMYFYHNHLYRTTAPLVRKIFNWLFDKKRREPILTPPSSLPSSLPSSPPLTPYSGSSQDLNK